ncbi:MAG: hypothetical protein IH987_06275 [Planctomycetes bacterium]|nr:hypothetical protein [Planctomycetota bacterium]
MANERAIRELSSLLDRVDADSSNELNREGARIRSAKEAVIVSYSPMFSSENLNNLTAEEFRDFLLYRNNKHWDCLQRWGGHITANMPRLQEAIRVLVEENVPLRTRLNRLRPKGDAPMIKGLACAVITPILQIMYPDKYGVLNEISKEGMKRLDLWPEMPRGPTFAELYEAVNRVLLETAARLQIDLWTLDMLWWRLVRTDVPR